MKKSNFKSDPENQLFKLMEKHKGMCMVHTKFLTLEEAEEMKTTHESFFSDHLWFVEPHQQEELQELKQEGRIYNNNACDGWEDIYPDRSDN